MNGEGNFLVTDRKSDDRFAIAGYLRIVLRVGSGVKASLSSVRKRRFGISNAGGSTVTEYFYLVT